MAAAVVCFDPNYITYGKQQWAVAEVQWYCEGAAACKKFM